MADMAYVSSALASLKSWPTAAVTEITSALAAAFINLAGSTAPVDTMVAAASPNRSRILSVTDPDEDTSAETSATRILLTSIVEDSTEDVPASPSITISLSADDVDSMSPDAAAVITFSLPATVAAKLYVSSASASVPVEPTTVAVML